MCGATALETFVNYENKQLLPSLEQQMLTEASQRTLVALLRQRRLRLMKS